MTDLHESARKAIAAYLDFLNGQRAEGVAESFTRLQAQMLGDEHALIPEATQKPVAKYFAETCDEAQSLLPEFISALNDLSDHLCWSQSASYTDDILGQGFGENYAWAEIIGDHGFFRGNDFTFGVLLLGPNRHYIDHYHPAPELYVPLTPGSTWRKGESDFVARQPAEIIWHPAMTIHATKTGEKPLLAPYIWTQDVATAAKLKIK